MAVFLAYSKIDDSVNENLACVGHDLTTKSNNVFEYAGSGVADNIVVLGDNFTYSGNQNVGGNPRQVIGLRQEDTSFSLRFFNTSIGDLVGLSEQQQIEKIFREGDYIRGYAGAATNDVLRGYDGNDDIGGGLGADKMYGGKGNDQFTVSEAGDQAFEQSGEGTDVVVASVSYSLAGQAIENLRLVGNAKIKGAGNALSNLIIGNKTDNVLAGNGGNDILNAGDGNDRLVGGNGIDRMVGGRGNDRYVVDSRKDHVVEIGNKGIDSVEASFSYSLKANFENLRLTGSRDLSGTGNKLDNIITGNGGDNTINGKLGNDRLIGLSGDDTFVFDTKLGRHNVDHIKDFSVARDEIHLAKSVFPHIALGELDAHAFKDIGSAALDADDRILYDRHSGTLSYDADGSGAGHAVRFAVLDTHPSLDAHNIFIV